uniref:Uncharacterized protein n=1 Tax=Knipowitschia caucasica TaxID=637954 RepID=A0AAV2JKM2_KNICA
MQWIGESAGQSRTRGKADLSQYRSRRRRPATPAESQDQVTLVAFHSLDCLGDNSNEEDAADPTAQDSTDPMRSYTNSCSGALDGNQIPPVLRHRKGPRSSEPTDNQRRRTSAADRDHISDYGLGDSWEPYVLLMLWLLLYCCWVLPQLDLKTVPSLFFNTRQ